MSSTLPNRLEFSLHHLSSFLFFSIQKYNTADPTGFVSIEPTNSRPSLFEEDVEKSKMLQKLLKSNKADDLKAANLLIKTMVKEVSLVTFATVRKEKALSDFFS